MKLRVASRGSGLAVRQAETVAGMMKKNFPLEFEIVRIKTTGDKILDAPLAKIGGKGLFVKEIDEAVLEGRVDFAVHSMKDVPTSLPDGLEIAAVPKREETNDVLIAGNGKSLEELPSGSIVGTSSLRRKAELLSYRPDVKTADIRGNVETRIKKVVSGEYDAIIMAKAGMKRMGIESRITQVLSKDIFLPSVGQGAIAVVARQNSNCRKFFERINDAASAAEVKAERALLKHLGGGCQVPVGVVIVKKEKLRLKAAVLTPDGKKKIVVETEGSPKKADAVGKRAANMLLENGADVILESIKSL